MQLDPIQCANPGCKRMFTPKTKRERYCKAKCAKIGERAVKRRWWNGNRGRKAK